MALSLQPNSGQYLTKIDKFLLNLSVAFLCTYQTDLRLLISTKSLVVAFAFKGCQRHLLMVDMFLPLQELSLK